MTEQELRALIEAAQWSGGLWLGETEAMADVCPWCKAGEHEGHADECAAAKLMGWPTRVGAARG